MNGQKDPLFTLYYVLLFSRNFYTFRSKLYDVATTTLFAMYFISFTKDIKLTQQSLYELVAKLGTAVL